MSKHLLTREKLRAGRALADLTQEELAASAGIAVSTVTEYEKGRSSPHRTTLDAIVRCLAGAGVVLTARGVERST
jgi:transcriptional regulator with XRE-family HTH domain